MDRWQLPDPRRLTKHDLAQIVGEIQSWMYVTEWTENRVVVSPDAEVIGSDLVEAVHDILFRYGLVPKEVRSTKDWRPE